MNSAAEGRMNAPLELDRPQNFPADIVAAVTRANLQFDAPHGFQARTREGLPEGIGERHRAVLAAQLGFSPEDYVRQNQVHGDGVQIVRHGAATRDSDGLICSEAGVALAVNIADCAAILLCDPVQNVIGGLHSGWRGTRDGIALRGVSLMNSAFGCEPADMLAYVSACASVDNYEVGPEVARQFPADTTRRDERGRLFLDIRARIAQQLIESGLDAAHIEMSTACTIGDRRYHSHRRDGRQAGRAMAVILRRA